MELFLLHKYGRSDLLLANDFIIQTDQFEESHELNSLDAKKFYIEDMEIFANENIS